MSNKIKDTTLLWKHISFYMYEWKDYQIHIAWRVDCIRMKYGNEQYYIGWEWRRMDYATWLDLIDIDDND